MNKGIRTSGFSLIEIMLAIAIIAILATIAMTAYKGYITSAATVELVERIDTIKEKVNVDAIVKDVDLCVDPPISLVDAHLDDPNVRLAVVKQDLHYAKPLALHVMAHKGAGKPRIAKNVYEHYKGDTHLGPNPIVTDSAVSFTIFLSPSRCVASATVATPSKAVTPPPPLPPVAKPAPAKAATPSPSLPPVAKPAPAPAVTQNKQITLTSKPSIDNHPCPDKQVFVPDNGKDWDGSSPLKGTCKAANQNYSDHYADMTCQVCNGPDQICEKLHKDVTCSWPNNFCVNTIKNSDSGARTVNRRCGNYEEAYHEWYLGSSDNDRCQTFEQGNIYTLNFECTYACQGENCNVKLHPDHNTLFK